VDANAVVPQLPPGDTTSGGNSIVRAMAVLCNINPSNLSCGWRQQWSSWSDWCHADKMESRWQLVVAVAMAAPIQNNIEKGKEEKVHCKKLVAALDIKKINNRKVLFVAIFPPTMTDKPTCQ